MTSQAMKRVNAEWKSIQQDPPLNWKIDDSIKSLNWNQWRIEITAPFVSPFHTIPFYLRVKFPENYPFQSPEIKLEKPHLFFHPNISYIDGAVCQNTVKEKSIHLQVKQRIDAVVRLLFNPNCNSPLNGRAACLYEENYTDYCKIAFLIFRGVEKLDEYVKR